MFSRFDYYKDEADPECEICEGNGRVEQVRLRADGEVMYDWHPCECTVDKGNRP